MVEEEWKSLGPYFLSFSSSDLFDSLDGITYTCTIAVGARKGEAP